MGNSDWGENEELVGVVGRVGATLASGSKLKRVQKCDIADGSQPKSGTFVIEMGHRKKLEPQRHRVHRALGPGFSL
jgi:hypothetical protein